MKQCPDISSIYSADLKQQKSWDQQRDNLEPDSILRKEIFSRAHFISYQAFPSLSFTLFLSSTIAIPGDSQIERMQRTGLRAI